MTCHVKISRSLTFMTECKSRACFTIWITVVIIVIITITWFICRNYYNLFGIYCVSNTLDTSGNCQRPVLLLGVSQHMHNNKPVRI